MTDPSAAAYEPPEKENHSQSLPKDKRPSRTRWLPGTIPSVIVVLCIIGVTWARLTGIRGDAGEVNAMTFGCTFVAALALSIWFIFRSSYSKRLRYGFLAALFLLIAGFVSTFRICHFSGEMIPQFCFRWARASLDPLDIKAGNVDLVTKTPLDFPQFLGPNRNGRITTLQLTDDWSRNPPKLIWKHPIGAGWSAFAAVNGYAVTMEQRGDEELVTCYEVHTGKLRWVHAIKARHETLLGGVGPRSTPTIDEGRVFALGATGVLRCLDGRNGKLVWSRDLLQEFDTSASTDSSEVAWGRANSPLIVDDLVVVPAGGHGDGVRSLVAFNKHTGERVWDAGRTQISYSSPILGTLNNRRQIISVNENTVTGHDPKSGEQLWMFDWPGSSSGPANTSQPTIFKDSVVVSKGYAQGMARYSITNGEAKKIYANRRAMRTKLTSMVASGDYGYGLSDGILECVDLNDGQSRWKVRAGDYGHGQILIVGDRILVITEKTGDLALVAATPSRFQELARISALGGDTWNNMCLYGRFLLLRNAEEAACFELPLRET